MKALYKTAEILAADGSLISVSDSYLTGKYDEARHCNFCQKPIDQDEIATALQIEGELTVYHRCNSCKSAGLSLEACVEVISSIRSVFIEYRKTCSLLDI